MADTIYGVDSSGEVTPLAVREALVLCFYESHCTDAGLNTKGGDGPAIMAYCRNTVEKAFIDSGGDFENPTKESIVEAMQKLAEIAKSFRDPETIKKHSGEVMKLVEKL